MPGRSRSGQRKEEEVSEGREGGGEMDTQSDKKAVGPGGDTS